MTCTACRFEWSISICLGPPQHRRFPYNRDEKRSVHNKGKRPKVSKTGALDLEGTKEKTKEVDSLEHVRILALTWVIHNLALSKWISFLLIFMGWLIHKCILINTNIKIYAHMSNCEKKTEPIIIRLDLGRLLLGWRHRRPKILWSSRWLRSARWPTKEVKCKGYNRYEQYNRRWYHNYVSHLIWSSRVSAYRKSCT